MPVAGFPDIIPPMAKVTLNGPITQFKASPIAVWAAMFTIYIIWGSTYLGIKFAVETMPPFTMAATRFLIAGAILFVLRRMAGDPIPTRIEARSAATVGLFLLVGGNGAVTWAEQTIPSGLAALMVSSAPLWMLTMEALLPGGRRPSKRVLAGIFIGFAGVLLLLWPGQNSGMLDLNPLGTGALIFATLAWSFGSIFSRHLRLPSSAMMGTAVEMLAGGAILLAIGGLTGELGRLNPAAFSLQSILALAYLTIFGSLVAFTAYTWLLRVAPTSLVSTYAYVNPLVALTIGALLGNEIFSPRTLAAAAVILASVVLTTSQPVTREEPANLALEPKK
jgi:drug/metabolite transporter (DMT)-like permease